jgi:hypothetical protein
MPDHAHLIYRLLGHVNMSDTLQHIKGRSAKKINQVMERRGSLWMDESFDRIIRKEEELEEKIDYIRQNPIEKGLALQPSDYKWLWVVELSKDTGQSLCHYEEGATSYSSSSRRRAITDRSSSVVTSPSVSSPAAI